jgi:hypothetical protein
VVEAHDALLVAVVDRLEQRLAGAVVALGTCSAVPLRRQRARDLDGRPGVT